MNFFGLPKIPLGFLWQVEKHSRKLSVHIRPFHKNLILGIAIVLGPIETNVGKCFFPKYVSLPLNCPPPPIVITMLKLGKMGLGYNFLLGVPVHLRSTRPNCILAHHGPHGITSILTIITTTATTITTITISRPAFDALP